MSIEKTLFGTLPDGKNVFQYTMKNANGMVVKVINYGGIITSILVPDKQGNIEDVALGYDSLEQYVNDKNYLGAIVGRVANRIAGASINIDGKIYNLAKNNGNNCLHGGINGFHRRLWDVETGHSDRGETICLHYISKDGEEGFPGNVDVHVTYTLTSKNALIFDFKAKTDKKTIVNITQHTSVNLSAGKQKNILDHELQLFAKQFLPCDESQIPTGEFSLVNATPFNFTQQKRIGSEIDNDSEQLRYGSGFDHTWILDKTPINALALAARLVEPSSGRILEVLTTEPGIHFYSGNFIANNTKGKNGLTYGHRYGLALETQHFPDSINKPHFPSVILDVGKEFTSTTIFEFKTGN